MYRKVLHSQPFPVRRRAYSRSLRKWECTSSTSNKDIQKCSIAIVDENSIITYDAGIAKACEGIEDLSVLLVQPGFVRLDGYDTGFIGGTCGRVGDELVFNGDLSSHPDFPRILEFNRGTRNKMQVVPRVSAH